MDPKLVALAVLPIGFLGLFLFVFLWWRRPAWGGPASHNPAEANLSQRLLPLLFASLGIMLALPLATADFQSGAEGASTLVLGKFNAPPVRAPDRFPWLALFAGLVGATSLWSANTAALVVFRWALRVPMLLTIAWFLCEPYAREWGVSAWAAHAAGFTLLAAGTLLGLDLLHRRTGPVATIVSWFLPVIASGLLPVGFYWIGAALPAALGAAALGGAMLVAFARHELTLAHGPAHAAATFSFSLLLGGTLQTSNDTSITLAPLWGGLITLATLAAGLLTPSADRTCPPARSLLRLAAGTLPMLLAIGIAARKYEASAY